MDSRDRADTQWLRRQEVAYRIARNITQLATHEAKLEALAGKPEEELTVSKALIESKQVTLSLIKLRLEQQNQLFFDWEVMSNEQKAQSVDAAVKTIGEIEQQMKIVDEGMSEL